MTKLLFLGSGSAFTVGADNFQSNMLFINDQDEKLLIDCGTDIRFSLYEEGFSQVDIQDIYISHLHADHVGGLEFMGLSTKFDPNCLTPNLFISQEIADALWEKSLVAGMGMVNGATTKLTSFFNIFQIENDRKFIWKGVKFEIIRLVHINAGHSIMPSFGLFFEADGIKIFITTDIQFQPESVINIYEQADIIFHDCEITPFASKVHPHYHQLVSLPESIKRKIWLYGYQPGKLPCASKDGFIGFVKRGQIFDFTAMKQTREKGIKSWRAEL